MADRRLRAFQAAGALGIIGLGVRSVVNNIGDVELKPVIWHLDWTPLAQGLACTLMAYAIQAWSVGEIIRGWDIRLAPRTTVRLWVRSNLARYLPKGRLTDRLIVIAEEEGLSYKYAAGAAVHPPLVRLGTGAAMAMVLLGLLRYGSSRLYLPLLLLGALVALIATFGLAGTDIPRRIAMSIGRPESVRPIDAENLGIAVLGNIAAWVLAGLGLSLIGTGLLEGFRPDWMLVTGALAASIVAGYAFLLLPTGLLLREAVLYTLLKGEVGVGPALAVASAYRAVLTFVELSFSSFLLLRRPSRDVT